MTKLLMLAVAVTALLLGGSSLAQDTKSPQPKAAPSAAATDTNPQMDEQMRKMQSMHDKMMNAKTPEERRKLMDEHRRTMQDSMGMMNQMMHGGGMMGSGMMGQKGASGDTNAQLQTMQKRMDMMQMMMQMMMDQQGMMGAPSGSAAAPKK